MTRWFWILLHIFNNVCWKHAKWNGDNLICEKCGKLIGFKVPVNRGGKTFYFYPTTQEGLMHQTEICDRYKLLNMTSINFDADYDLHKIINLLKEIQLGRKEKNSFD